jgi:hypothetical protein
MQEFGGSSLDPNYPSSDPAQLPDCINPVAIVGFYAGGVPLKSLSRNLRHSATRRVIMPSPFRIIRTIIGPVSDEVSAKMKIIIPLEIIHCILYAIRVGYIHFYQVLPI